MAADPTARILKGPLAFELARFGAPLAVGMALQTTFNLVDAYLIAHLPAADVGPAVGALGVCDQLAAIGTILSYGVSTATAAILSQGKGAGNDESVRKVAWQSMIVVAALSLVFALAGLVFAKEIVAHVIGVKGAAAKMATSYLRVIVGGGFSIFFLLQMTSILRALGSAKTPAGFMVGGNVINVGIAIAFIFGWGPIHPMGMMGAAWATIVARSITLVPIAIILGRRFGVKLPEHGSRAPDRKTIGKIGSLAWPSSAQFVLRITAMLFVSSIVARAFTTPEDQTATTGMGLVFRLDTMALFIAMGWGSASQTFVGQSLGAGDEARATKSGWITAAYDAITNVGLVALVYFAGAKILRLFDDDPAPVAIALDYLSVVAPSYLALGFGVVLGNAMAGAGATRTTLVVDAAVIVGFQVPLSIAVVALGGSLHALFLCVAATNVLSAIVYAAVYARGSWRKAAIRARTSGA